VTSRHYGCGCPIPEGALSGLRALDPGCGAGVDCFVLARQAGPSGFVHGMRLATSSCSVMDRFG